MLPQDLGWIAGFLEGEGSFYARRDKHGSVTKVSAPQVQREPLERLQRLVGGQIYTRPDKCFVWHLTKAKEAVGLMLSIWHLMSPKRREQIRRAISVWRQPKRSRWGKETLNGWC